MPDHLPDHLPGPMPDDRTDHPSALPAQVLSSLVSPATNDDGLLGRSVMKWGSDGELSAMDLQHILARLSTADAQAAGMMACPVDPF
ncbi:MAG: hypothetical protein VKI63_08620 [Cyanobium sp.]|nr:hypothetical protein [Cyanobium sp.]